jgi:hypothetical protein
MSRYSEKIKIEELECDVAYGHDHATGYFVQIYSPQYDEPVVEYDDLFGWSVLKHCTAKQHEVATQIVKEVKAETKFTERMDRDPSNHLGARLAAMLMPTKGNA